jgi:hypothetical protein
MSFLGFYHIILVHPVKSLVAITLLLLVSASIANAQTPTEEDVKAVYVYNFVNFVEWPTSSFKSSSDPFVIGIAGPDNYANILQELVKGETYKGMMIEVRKIGSDTEVSESHILYIDKNSSMIDRLISKAASKAILTISDNDHFMHSGGIVRFFIEESKVKVEINQALAQERSLPISAKLLRLAKLYKREDR